MKTASATPAWSCAGISTSFDCESDVGADPADWLFANAGVGPYGWAIEGRWWGRVGYDEARPSRYRRDSRRDRRVLVAGQMLLVDV